MGKQFVLYTTDNTHVVCAIPVDDDTVSVMGFSPAPVNTRRKPEGLVTRKQVFQNTAGERIRLPYPTTTYPYAFGLVTVRGDATYFAIGTLAERNTGEST